jgi:hypothetical protein
MAGTSDLAPNRPLSLRPVFANDNTADRGSGWWTINVTACPDTTQMVEPIRHLTSGVLFDTNSERKHTSDPPAWPKLRVHVSPARRPATRQRMSRCSAAKIDFVADNPGLTLFHCQLHMLLGFISLFDYRKPD